MILQRPYLWPKHTPHAKLMLFFKSKCCQIFLKYKKTIEFPIAGMVETILTSLSQTFTLSPPSCPLGFFKPSIIWQRTSYVGCCLWLLSSQTQGETSVEGQNDHHTIRISFPHLSLPQSWTCCKSQWLILIYLTSTYTTFTVSQRIEHKFIAGRHKFK